MRKIKPSVCLILTLALTGAVGAIWVSAARAQFGPGIGQSDLIRQAQESAQFMRKYRRSHDHLPQLQPEIDDALINLYKAVSITQPDTTITPQSSNTYRTYYNFAMACDTSIRGLSVVNGQIRPPDSWTAPPNSVVILSDGQDQFVIWVAGVSYKPMLDPTTNQAIIIYQNLAPPPQ